MIKRRKKVTTIKDVLPEVIKENRFHERCEESDISKTWEKTFGKECGRYLGRNGNVIRVEIDSSAQRYDLEFRKQELLERIVGKEGFHAVNDIRFVER